MRYEVVDMGNRYDIVDGTGRAVMAYGYRPGHAQSRTRAWDRALGFRDGANFESKRRDEP